MLWIIDDRTEVIDRHRWIMGMNSKARFVIDRNVPFSRSLLELRARDTERDHVFILSISSKQQTMPTLPFVFHCKRMCVRVCVRACMHTRACAHTQTCTSFLMFFEEGSEEGERVKCRKKDQWGNKEEENK